MTVVTCHRHRVLVFALLTALWPGFAPPALAQDQQSFSVSNVNVRYGWTFREPNIAEDVPKNIFTFENTAAGRWWSSYLFVDVLRSWSDADANAKEVYGEWYPTLSLRALSGRERSKGVLADVGLTVGLNTGVRSTGPSPFVVLPGLTFSLNSSRSIRWLTSIAGVSRDSPPIARQRPFRSRPRGRSRSTPANRR
jgi:hypothetical protein